MTQPNDFLEKVGFHYVQESSEFRKRSFESAVDSIRAIAASHLWQVLIEEHLVLPFILL